MASFDEGRGRISRVSAAFFHKNPDRRRARFCSRAAAGRGGESLAEEPVPLPRASAQIAPAIRKVVLHMQHTAFATRSSETTGRSPRAASSACLFGPPRPDHAPRNSKQRDGPANLLSAARGLCAAVHLNTGEQLVVVGSGQFDEILEQVHRQRLMRLVPCVGGAADAERPRDVGPA